MKRISLAAAVAAALLAGCGEGANEYAVEAGSDMTIAGNTTIERQCRASGGDDPSETTFVWEHRNPQDAVDARASVNFIDENGLLTLNIPRADSTYDVVMRCYGRDAEGESDTDSFRVTVLPASSIELELDAPDDPVVISSGDTFSVSGMARSLGSQIQGMVWSHSGTSNAPIEFVGDPVCEFETTDESYPSWTDEQECKATIKAGNVSEDTFSSMRLTATDTERRSASEVMEIRLTPTETPPVQAVPGSDRLVTAGSTVARSCQASGGFFYDEVDPEIKWEHVNVEEVVDAGMEFDFNIQPQGPNDVAVVMEFGYPQDGTRSDVRMRCTVTDDLGETDSAEVAFVVDELDPLEADVSGKTVTAGDTFTLTANVHDPEGLDNPIYYAWRQVGGPAANMYGTDGRELTVTAPSDAGGSELVFEVRVARSEENLDVAGGESVATATVTVNFASEW